MVGQESDRLSLVNHCRVGRSRHLVHRAGHLNRGHVRARVGVAMTRRRAWGKFAGRDDEEVLGSVRPYYDSLLDDAVAPFDFRGVSGRVHVNERPIGVRRQHRWRDAKCAERNRDVHVLPPVQRDAVKVDAHACDRRHQPVFERHNAECRAGGWPRSAARESLTKLEQGVGQAAEPRTDAVAERMAQDRISSPVRRYRAGRI